jgi:hypothetical protein
MESTEKTDLTTGMVQDQKQEEDGFEVTDINDVKEKLEDVHIGDQDCITIAFPKSFKEGNSKDQSYKLSAGSKAFTKPDEDRPKLSKTGRVFKPKDKPKEEDKSATRLENKGRTFKPKEEVTVIMF